MTGSGPDVGTEDITLQTYQAAAARYRELDSGPAPAVAALLDLLAASAGPGARVLELGSGPGRDALHLEKWGLHVDRTDATTAFVELLRADGHEARVLDARYDKFGGPYEAVLADAMLLHLNRAEFRTVLAKARAAVLDGGLLAFTVKEGDGDEWHSRRLDLPRHFTYWREPALRDELSAAGWLPVRFEHHAGTFDDWLHVLCRTA